MSIWLLSKDGSKLAYDIRIGVNSVGFLSGNFLLGLVFALGLRFALGLSYVILRFMLWMDFVKP